MDGRRPDLTVDHFHAMTDRVTRSGDRALTPESIARLLPEGMAEARKATPLAGLRVERGHR